MGLVWFKFDGAVDVIILEGFVEVPPIAEDTKCGVPAVKVPVLRIIRVGEQVHGGVADAFLSGALGACIGAYEISCLCEEVVMAGVACIDGFFWGNPKESGARVCAGCVECGGSDPHSFSVFAVLGGGRVLAGGGFSSGWLGIDVRGWCWWEFSCLLGVWLIGC